MIRTVYFRCHLPRTTADGLNRESGRIYTRVMVEHYRLYRKHGLWLRQAQAEGLDDAYHAAERSCLHAHSIDAAQQGFYSACKTAKTNRTNGLDGVKYPHKRKVYRTTVWKNTAIRLKETRTKAERKAQKPPKGQPRPLRFTDEHTILLLSMAEGLEPLEVALPAHLAGLPETAFKQMRLVFNKAGKHYEWHLVIEDAIIPEPVQSATVVAGDLGEIHPITLTDGDQAAVISCRQLRATRQRTNKELAKIQRAKSRCQKYSRKWWRLERRKRHFLEQQKRRVRDLEHKVSRAAVTFSQACGAAQIVIGDVRHIADGKRLNTVSQQKISQWSHGQLRHYITEKAAAVGIQVDDTVSEMDTTKTCPNPTCKHQYKPKGRTYRCPSCGLEAHRDVVGAVNILSRFLHGDGGLLGPPQDVKYRHPYSRKGKRSPSDTGHVAGNPSPHRTGDR